VITRSFQRRVTRASSSLSLSLLVALSFFSSLARCATSIIRYVSPILSFDHSANDQRGGIVERYLR